nr:J517_1871 family lipoprotein [Halomonas xinjiangensis]
MPMNDMMDNNFSAVIPEPIPEGMVGTWSGTMGPYAVTFRFEDNGMGLYCYDWNTTKAIHKIKYANGKIEHQDGKNMLVSQPNTSTIIADWPYTGANDVTLTPDESLANASVYCSKQLRS